MDKAANDRKCRAVGAAWAALGFWLAVWWLVSPPFGHGRWWAYGMGIALGVEALVKVTWHIAKKSS